MADQHFSALLEKIASAIGVPVSDFTDHSTVPTDRCSEPSVEEVAALVEAFNHVKNAEARRTCLEFVRLQRTTSQSRRREDPAGSCSRTGLTLEAGDPSSK